MLSSFVNMNILDQKIDCLIVTRKLYRKLIFMLDVFDNEHLIEFDFEVFCIFYVFQQLCQSQALFYAD